MYKIFSFLPRIIRLLRDNGCVLPKSNLESPLHCPGVNLTILPQKTAYPVSYLAWTTIYDPTKSEVRAERGRSCVLVQVPFCEYAAGIFQSHQRELRAALLELGTHAGGDKARMLISPFITAKWFDCQLDCHGVTFISQVQPHREVPAHLPGVRERLSRVRVPGDPGTGGEGGAQDKGHHAKEGIKIHTEREGAASSRETTAFMHG